MGQLLALLIAHHEDNNVNATSRRHSIDNDESAKFISSTERSWQILGMMLFESRRHSRALILICVCARMVAVCARYCSAIRYRGVACAAE